MHKLEELKCSYCNAILSSMPKRKTKCKVCNNHFYVNKHPYNGENFIVMEKEKDFIDLVRQVLISYDLPEEKFQNELKKQRGIDKILSDNDVMWAWLNKKVLSYMKQNSWAWMSAIYTVMAALTRSEGKAFVHLLKQAREMELMGCEFEGRNEVIIDTWYKESCDECKKLHGRIITVKEAMRTEPLPVHNCKKGISNNEKGWCRCSYRDL